MYFVCVGPNSMDSNPKYATSRWDSLEKNIQNSDKPYFHDEEYVRYQKKNKNPHIFTPPLPDGRGGVKICFVFFF